MEDKKNWRRDDLATRIDLRMPNEVYDRVVEIATAAGEKVNPKSGQVRLTSTLNKLIEIGIRYLSDDNPIFSSNNPVNIGLNGRIQELENKYQELSDKIKQDNRPVDIGLIENTVNNALGSLNIPSRGEFESIDSIVGAALQPIKEQLEEFDKFSRTIREELTKVKKASRDRQTPVTISTAKATIPDEARVKAQRQSTEGAIKSPAKAPSQLGDAVIAWVEFLNLVGVDMPLKRITTNADIAIKAGEAKGANYSFNSTSKNFRLVSK